ncbi:MAG: PQQ-binding-like beta-propeller repeat protein [bacterium]|nr:PQQ-binding-like beta-propeller repeat protein [bacterium]
MFSIRSIQSTRNPKSAIRNPQSGAVMIMTLAWAGLMLGFVALAVDVGRIYLARRELVTVADAAALAGSFDLPNNPAAAIASALDFARKNGFTSDEITIITPYQNERTTALGLAGDHCIGVGLDADIKLIFGRLLSTFGIEAEQIGALAVAYKPTMGPGWTFDAGGHVHASPIISNGKVFAGTAGYSSWGGNIFALDQDTGEKIWQFNTVYGKWGRYVDGEWTWDNTTYTSYGHTTSSECIQSTPTVAGDLVYIASTNGYAYALEAETGKPRWQYYIGIGQESNIWISSSPFVHNGVYYIGSVDKKIYALDAADGHLIDTYTTGDAVISSPNVINNILYVGSNDTKMYAFDLNEDGEMSLKWVYDTPGRIRGRPRVFDDKVYFGAGSKYVYALDAETGNKKWLYETSGHNPNLDFISSPFVELANDGKKVIHIGDGGGYAFALEENSSGNSASLKWDKKLDYRIESSPVVSHGVVYHGSRVGSSGWMGGHFWALNAETGEILDSFSMDNDTHASIYATDDFIYFGACDNLVHAVRINSPNNILARIVE